VLEVVESKYTLFRDEVAPSSTNGWCDGDLRRGLARYLDKAGRSWIVPELCKHEGIVAVVSDGKTGTTSTACSGSPASIE
jgi:hypothetical protein